MPRWNTKQLVTGSSEKAIIGKKQPNWFQIFTLSKTIGAGTWKLATPHGKRRFYYCDIIIFRQTDWAGVRYANRTNPSWARWFSNSLLSISTSVLKISCSVVDGDTSQVGFWCFTGHPKMMCIQKDEDLIEVNFSKKRSKYCHWSGTNMLWKLQQIPHHIFE